MVLLRSLVPGKQEQSVANKRVVNQVLVQHRVYYYEFIRLTSELCDPKLQSFSKTGTTQSRKKVQNPDSIPSFIPFLQTGEELLSVQSQTPPARRKKYSCCGCVHKKNFKFSLFNVDLSGLMKWFSCESAPSLWSRTLLKPDFKPT